MIEKLSGPIIGSVIGYCTNYIAVKMLFYPRKEIRVLGYKLPFTPGAIPKGQPRLAKAISNIVTTTLLSENDITEQLLSEEYETYAVDKIMDFLTKDIKSNLHLVVQSEDKYNELKNIVSLKFTEQLVDVLSGTDIGNIIAMESERIIKEKTAGTMLQMFLTDELIVSFIQPIGMAIQDYIAVNGNKYMEPEIKAKIDVLEKESILGICDEMCIERIEIERIIRDIYYSAVRNTVPQMIQKMNLNSIIENKVNEMSIDDLEKMVLSIMKKELDTIVNLGAVVGALLGMINMI